MEAQDSLSKRIATLARDLQGHQGDPEGTFQLSVELAKAAVPGCDGAGLSFVRARKVVETVAATDELVLAADRLQYELREGPVLDAIWQEPSVHSTDLEQDARWPQWGQRVVAETSARSVLSFQLFTHKDTLGALTLYSRTPDAFDQDAKDEAIAIAAHVAIAVAATEEVHQLASGLDSRTVIGQATGMIIERFDLDPARAFSVLMRLSQHGNVKLRDVAAEIVRTRGRDIGAGMDAMSPRKSG